MVRLRPLIQAGKAASGMVGEGIAEDMPRAGGRMGHWLWITLTAGSMKSRG
jgi:hypothetical protein